MHLASLDYMACSGSSILHRTQPIVKIILSLIILCAIIVLRDTTKLALLLVFSLALILISRINLKEAVHLAIYPLFFSLLFALIRVGDSFAEGLGIILKSLSIALTMIVLVSTTSYVDIFSFFSVFMPPLLVDIFVFSYRSLFILIDKLESVIKSIRLRGGYHPINLMTNLRSAAGILGIVIIHSIDMGERMYKVYSLRGYDGKIPIYNNKQRLKMHDVIILLATILITAAIFMIP